MLMDHTNARRDGGFGVSDLKHLAIDGNVTLVGFVKAVDDAHQCGLASTVFADDAVYGAFFDLQIDVLIGMYRTKVLVDAAQLEGVFCSRVGLGSHGSPGQ